MGMRLSEFMEQHGAEQVQFFKVAGPGVLEPSGKWRISVQDLRNYLSGGDYGSAVVRVFVSGMVPHDFVLKFRREGVALPEPGVGTAYRQEVDTQLLWYGPTSITVERFPLSLAMRKLVVSTNPSLQPTYIYTARSDNITFAGDNLVIVDIGQGFAEFEVYEATTGAVLNVLLELRMPERLSSEQELLSQTELEIYSEVNRHIFIDLSKFFTGSSDIVCEDRRVVIHDNGFATVLFPVPGVFDIEFVSGMQKLKIHFHISALS